MDKWTVYALLIFSFGFVELGGKLTTINDALGGSLMSIGGLLFFRASISLYKLVSVKKNLNTFTTKKTVIMTLREVKQIMRSLLKDTKAAISARSIIGLAIGFVLMAVLIPIGMDEVYAANTTAWETAVTTIFTLVMPIVVVIAGALSFISDIKS